MSQESFVHFGLPAMLAALGIVVFVIQRAYFIREQRDIDRQRFREDQAARTLDR